MTELARPNEAPEPEPVSDELVKLREAELRSTLDAFRAWEPPKNGRCDVFYSCEGRNETWEVRDSVHAVLDSLPTETAAENVARELNRAYQRGRNSMQDDIRQLLGVKA